MNKLRILHAFAQTRWARNFTDRNKLDRWQDTCLKYFLAEVLPQAPKFRNMKGCSLTDLPTMNKSVMIKNFDFLNTAGVTLEQAMSTALKAERDRDFSPMLGDLTVGLSSGTSGSRGVFLVSPRERAWWAGAILGRTLSPEHLRRVANPLRPKLRIAFFLRANSTLYNTIQSSRIDFRFFDLMKGVDTYLDELKIFSPHILVAPATVLRRVAEMGNIRPERVISVAEVLEPDDVPIIEEGLGIYPIQIYQATEGFLGYTCPHGTIHLNESLLHVEKKWIDATRFTPTITDFSRSCQLMVRYELNDILRIRETACPCGRAETALAAIEGRSDEITTIRSLEEGSVQVFPDTLRHAMSVAGDVFEEYSLAQSGATWEISVKPSPGTNLDHCQKTLMQTVETLCAALGGIPPKIVFLDWTIPKTGNKRRRILVKKETS